MHYKDIHNVYYNNALYLFVHKIEMHYDISRSVCYAFALYTCTYNMVVINVRHKVHQSIINIVALYIKAFYCEHKK